MDYLKIKITFTHLFEKLIFYQEIKLSYFDLLLKIKIKIENETV